MRKTLIEEKVRKYAEGMERIRKAFFRHPKGMETCHKIADLTDRILTDSYDSFRENLEKPLSTPLAVIALGGYGRRQLNPFSDIDIIVVYEKELPANDKKFVEDYISFLWDIRLKIGSTCRSLEDCVHFCNSDITIKTSFLEARFLCGDEKLFHHLEALLKDRVFAHNKKVFFQEKVNERQTKSEKFGSTIKSSSPNLKEAIGGLRDYHMILWIAHCFWGARNEEEIESLLSLPSLEKDALNDALELLLSIRTCLHFMFNKNVDDLTPESQRNVAITLKYKDTTLIPAEMLFMKDYYRSAITVNDLMQMLIRKTNRSLNKMSKFINRILIRRLHPPFKQSGAKVFVDENDFELVREKPEVLLELPSIMENGSLELSMGLVLLSRRIFHEMNPKDIPGSFKINYLLETLLHENSYQRLRVLEKIGALPVLINGYGEIENLVYHDVYHAFTVDEHTIQAVRHLEELSASTDAERKTLRELYKSIKRPDLLKLGILFHDIGKTYGRTHVQRGLRILEHNRRDWDADDYIYRTVHFLIKQHLELSMTAQRRNIYDTNTIKAFLKNIPSQEYLDMLYLLTYADMSAVTQGFLNSWKLNLLNQLYSISVETMEEKEQFSMVERKKRLIRKLIRESMQLLKEKGREVWSRKEIKDFLVELPFSYLNYTRAAKIEEDMNLLLQLQGQPVSVSLINEKEVPYSEITICAKNKRGLFNKIAASLINNGINVKGANICSSSKDWVLDTFQVDTIEESGKLTKNLAGKIASDLTRLIEGSITKEELFATRKKYIRIKDFHNVKSPTIINIDNETSDQFTILEVIMEDMPGVLYFLSKILFDLEVDINSCFLASEGNRAVDTFYITRDGQKIFDNDFESRLRIKLASINE